MAKVISKVISVEVKRARNGSPYSRIQLDNGMFFNRFNDAEISNTQGKIIEIEYEKNDRGMNDLKSWAYAPEGAKSESAAPASSGSSRESGDRQESIERQSCLSRAIDLVSAMMASGNHPIAAKAAKDPEVWKELVFSLARDMKVFVQEGDWSQDKLPAADEPSDG